MVERNPEFAARMRAHLSGWAPEDALVPWLLMHAADPTGASDTFRDISYQPEHTTANADVELTAGEDKNVGQSPRAQRLDHPPH